MYPCPYLVPGGVGKRYNSVSNSVSIWRNTRFSRFWVASHQVRFFTSCVRDQNVFTSFWDKILMHPLFPDHLSSRPGKDLFHADLPTWWWRMTTTWSRSKLVNESDSPHGLTCGSCLVYMCNRQKISSFIGMLPIHCTSKQQPPPPKPIRFV